jgi:hypothetical protein
MPKITVDQVLDPEAQHQLMHLADLGETVAWEKARLVEKIADQYRFDDKWRLPAKTFFAAVGLYLKTAASTARSYWDVASKVPENLAEEYPIGFHGHKAVLAVSHGDTEVHRQICAEWMATADDFGGNPGSLDALRAWLEKFKSGQETPRWQVILRRMRRTAQALRDEADTPVAVIVAAADFIEATDSIAGGE